MILTICALSAVAIIAALVVVALLGQVNGRDETPYQTEPEDAEAHRAAIRKILNRYKE